MAVLTMLWLEVCFRHYRYYISPLSQVLENSVRIQSSELRIITGSEPRKFSEVAEYNTPSARDKKTPPKKTS